MTAGLAAGAIRVLSDNEADIAAVQAVLKPAFGNVEVSGDAGQPAKAGDANGAVVFLLAYRRLQVAERCARALRGGSAKELLSRRIVVLCDKADHRRAFELARQGVFDDYAVFWPFQHDGLRLPMSVHAALRIMSLAPAVDGGGPDLAAEIRKFGQLDALLEERIGQADASIDTARRMVAGARQGVEQAFDGLPLLLTDAEMDELVSVRDPQGLGRLLARVHTGQVQPLLDRVEGTLEPMAQWASDLRSELQPHMTRLRALSAAARTERPIVLVVDDNAVLRSTIRNMLTPNHFSVLQADSGAAALRVLQDSEVDLVLMDLSMPDLDGLQTIQRIRVQERLRAIPIIVLTGRSDPAAVRESLAAGARDFIVKPFKTALLLAKIERLLGR